MLCWACRTSLWFSLPAVRKGRVKPVEIVAECPSCGQRYAMRVARDA